METVLEKGKGPVLGKLRIIQLIEDDLQLAIRVLLTHRSSVNAEIFPRLSKQNFGNRKGYDINTAILQKKVIKDLVNTKNLPFIHYIDDRKACYDRQLPEIGMLVEISFGIAPQVAELFCKVLKNFEHHLSTAYGVSDEFYGGHNDPLGGNG